MRTQLIPLIGAAIAVVLQIIVAPLITFFSVVPGFIVSYVIVLGILRGGNSMYWYAFVLGMIADLLSQTPLGLTPFLLLIAVFVLSRVFEVLDQTTPAMPLIACAVTLLVFEVLFAVGLLIAGYEGGISLIVSRALPATLINAIICVIYYFLMRRLPFERESSSAWTISQTQRFR